MKRWLLGLCVLLSACTVQIPEHKLGCSNDSDCPSGWSCQQGLCSQSSVMSLSDAGGIDAASEIRPGADAAVGGDDLDDSGVVGVVVPSDGGAPPGKTPTGPADCAVGQGWDNGDEQCHACQFAPRCDEPGETGQRIVLHGNSGTECICETKADYYILGQRAAVPCDSDGDGWVVDEAQVAVENADPVIRENARCRVRRVQRVVLHNELGERLIAEDFSQQFGAPDRNIPNGLPLYESRRNDGTSGTALPEYGRGDAARMFLPQELNSLTKGCSDPTADFNDNGVSDVNESAKSTPQLPDARFALTPYYTKYLRFSYFLELHDGWFAQLDGLDSYSVAEKTRDLTAEQPVPLLYAENTDSVGSDPHVTYAQTCPRHPDAAYLRGGDGELPMLADGNPTGADFVEFSTAAVAEAWHGMTHHSQYKCTFLVTQASYESWQGGPANDRDEPQVAYPGAVPHELQRKDAAGIVHTYPWTTNTCVLESAESSRPAYGPVRNPKWPSVRCAVTPAKADSAVWAAVRYENYAQFYVDAKHRGDYQRGCVNGCQGQTWLLDIPNDCKSCVPSVSGEPTAVIDPSDLPADDGNVCTSEVCDGLQPTHPAVPTGTMCGAGVCQDGACTSCLDGETQCTPDGTALQTCSAGTWGAAIPCPGSVCHAKACGTCTPGNAQCSGTGARQVCDSAGQWGAAVACETGLCSGAGDCGQCKPNSQRCNASGGLDVCTDAGSWEQRTCSYGCASDSCRLCPAKQLCCTGDEIGCGGCTSGCCSGTEAICVDTPRCFAAGTLVTMADGTELAIERVGVGQQVLAYDVTTQQLMAATVTGRLVHPETTRLTVLNGTLITTPEHPFFVEGRWLAAATLPLNAKLMHVAPGASTLGESALQSSQSAAGPITTYNLEIAGAHNYFAGGFLVHNIKFDTLQPVPVN